MKKVFYLTDEIEFYETQEEIITWTYKWNGLKAYSQALRELIETNYNLN